MFCQPLVYLQPGGEHNTFRGVGLPVVQLIHGFSGFLGASCFKKQKDFTGLAIKMLELSTGIPVNFRIKSRGPVAFKKPGQASPWVWPYA